MGSKWDERDRTDVPVLTVERIWIARGAEALSGAVRIHGRWTQDGRGEVCRLLGLWLWWSSRPGDRRLPGGGWAPGGLLWPRSLGEHCPHQEEQSQCREESRAGLHGPTAKQETGEGATYNIQLHLVSANTSLL